MANKYGENNNELKNENDNLNNQLLENKQRIDSLLDENNKLNLLINDYKAKKSKLENDLTMSLQYQKQANNKHGNEIQEIISYCNENIEQISNWIDSTFINNNNDDELNLNTNQLTLNSSHTMGQFNINFDPIKTKLLSAQEKIKKEMSSMKKFQQDKTNLILNEKSTYLNILKTIYNNITLDVQNHNDFKLDLNQSNNTQSESDEIIQFLNIINTSITQVMKYL